MRIWHISDTHNRHEKLIIPENIDMVIHSGDATTARKSKQNFPEMEVFAKWFSSLAIEHKIFVPGNHDSSIASGRFNKQMFSELGIHMLNMETIEIEGVKIWGSAYTPTFGRWSFMKARNKMMSEVWSKMNLEADILVSHGPPFGILDLTTRVYRDSNGETRVSYFEHVGCKSLLKMLKQSKAKLLLFGHCHSKAECLNNGLLRHPDYPMVFSNAASLVDKASNDRFKYNGNIIELVSSRIFI